MCDKNGTNCGSNDKKDRKCDFINALVNVINSEANDVTIDLADDILFAVLNDIELPKSEENEEVEQDV